MNYNFLLHKEEKSPKIPNCVPKGNTRHKMEKLHGLTFKGPLPFSSKINKSCHF